jgi:hypothetical protein
MYVLISHSFPLPNPTGLKVGDVANGRAWLGVTWSFDLVNAMYHEYLLEYLVK